MMLYPVSPTSEVAAGSNAHKRRYYIGNAIIHSLPLIIGIGANILVVLPTVHYFFLPRGTTILPNIPWDYDYSIAAVAFFIGIPVCIWQAVRCFRRGKHFVFEIVAILLCLAPLFLLPFLMHTAGVMRDLSGPCYPCDGDTDTIKWANVKSW